MRRGALAASVLALCAAVPTDLVRREQTPLLLQETNSADSPGAAHNRGNATRYILFFVPLPDNGESHHNISKYVAGLTQSCFRLRQDRKDTFFAGDHSFIYAHKIYACYPIVRASPPALNFTYYDLPFEALAESMPDDCSYKFANLSKYDPPTTLGAFKQVARIYLSKIDVLCDAAAALGAAPGQRYALLDALIGSNQNQLPEADSYMDATYVLESETLAPGVLRTQLYSDILTLLRATMGETETFWRAIWKGVGSLSLYGQPTCNLPDAIPGVKSWRDLSAFQPFKPFNKYSHDGVVVARLLATEASGCERVRQAFHDELRRWPTTVCPCFDEEAVLTRMRWMASDINVSAVPVAYYPFVDLLAVAEGLITPGEDTLAGLPEQKDQQEDEHDE